MRLLFVCVGNTCRSQMAEAIAKNLGHYANSAGTHPGNKVAINTIDRQRPKSISEIDITGFDKIISMGCGVECPEINIDIDWNLKDPYGQDLDFYRQTRDRISKYIHQL
jgi:arsenate reductase